MTQRIKFKIAVYSLLFIAACLLLSWFSLRTSASSRDYQRLAHMKEIQARMSGYYHDLASYRLTGCQEGQALSACSGDGVSFSDLRDPAGGSYVVYSLSEDDYQIGLFLESSVGGLAPGAHLFGKNGITQ